jgi:hypothetical protein
MQKRSSSANLMAASVRHAQEPTQATQFLFNRVAQVKHQMKPASDLGGLRRSSPYARHTGHADHG